MADSSVAFQESHVALRQILSDIKALPAGPVEPADLWLADSPGSLGKVRAPGAVSPADVVLESLPPISRPGRLLTLIAAFKTALQDKTDSSVIAAAAGMLASHGLAVFRLTQAIGGIETTTCDLVGVSRCTLHDPRVEFSVIVPADAPIESRLTLLSFAVAGQQISVEHMASVCVRNARGTPAPRVVKDACSNYVSTPAISADGVIYVGRTWDETLHVNDPSDSTRVGIDLEPLGLCRRTVTTALSEDGGTLFLGEDEGSQSILLAIDARSCAVRWRTERGAFSKDILGASVIDQQGIVVASDICFLRVHRMTDGARLASIEAKEARMSAYDPLSRSLFVNILRSRVGLWSFESGSSTPVSRGVLAHLDSDHGSWRPLAVVPPAPGNRCAYLVVGNLDTPTLCIYALPGLECVHRHTLADFSITGLAGDPAGTALAVCDSITCAVHVLCWPLPGMPPLQ